MRAAPITALVLRRRQLWLGALILSAGLSKGSFGQRAVTDVRGRPMTVPSEDFPELTFVGGHKPAAN